MENEKQVFEYRGIENLVVARILKDSKQELTFDTPRKLAGVKKITKSVQTSSEPKFCDNKPKFMVTAIGNDDFAIDATALDDEEKAYILGSNYDPETGILLEGSEEPPYCAIGYIFKDTRGIERFVIRYKGMFGFPSDEYNTEDNSTNTTGNSLVYTGIYPEHEFETDDGKKSFKGYILNTNVKKVDKETFFSKITLHTEIKSNAVTTG